MWENGTPGRAAGARADLIPDLTGFDAPAAPDPAAPLEIPAGRTACPPGCPPPTCRCRRSRRAPPPPTCSPPGSARPPARPSPSPSPSTASARTPRICPPWSATPTATRPSARLTAVGLAVPVAAHYRLAAGVTQQLAAAFAADGELSEVQAHTAALHYAWWTGHPSVTPARAAAESEAIIAAMTACRDDGNPSAAVLLARTVAPAFAAALHWGAWERALRIGQEAARLSGEVAEEAYFHHELGVLALCTGTHGPGPGRTGGVHRAARRPRRPPGHRRRPPHAGAGRRPWRPGRARSNCLPAAPADGRRRAAAVPPPLAVIQHRRRRPTRRPRRAQAARRGRHPPQPGRGRHRCAAGRGARHDRHPGRDVRGRRRLRPEEPGQADGVGPAGRPGRLVHDRPRDDLADGDRLHHAVALRDARRRARRPPRRAAPRAAPRRHVRPAADPGRRLQPAPPPPSHPSGGASADDLQPPTTPTPVDGHHATVDHSPPPSSTTTASPTDVAAHAPTRLAGPSPSPSRRRPERVRGAPTAAGSPATADSGTPTAAP